MAKKVVIYTKPGCPYCRAAKEDLQKRGIPYEEIDVFATPGAQAELEAKTGQRSVPVIVAGDKVMVGFGGA